MLIEKEIYCITIMIRALGAIAKGLPQYLEILYLLNLNILILQKQNKTKTWLGNASVLKIPF